MSGLLKNDALSRQRAADPGPGHYDSQADAAMRGAPSYKMGTESRNKGPGRDINPDPGMYNPDYSPVKNKAPGYKIGSELRQGMGNPHGGNMPGPGNYDLNPAAFDGKPKFAYGQKL